MHLSLRRRRSVLAKFGARVLSSKADSLSRIINSRVNILPKLMEIGRGEQV